MIRISGHLSLQVTSVVFTLLLLVCTDSRANIVLPSVFSDNMVLQQRSQVRIWGWAKPREPVVLKVSWMGTALETVGDNHANWAFTIETPAAGGPFTIEIKGYNTITLSNVMIGEVWLCSGQSNMEWTPNAGIDSAAAEISRANHPAIRFITIQHASAPARQLDVRTNGWSICTPETMQQFSAVAYFFARTVHQDTNVTIGLINTSWGGTPAEAWTDMMYTADPSITTGAAALLPDAPWGPKEPGIIYNAMVAGLVPYRIAGVIWYQGEENTKNAARYERVFSSMIGSWRNAWGYDFPFYYVQIAPFEGYKGYDGVRVRDAQRRALQVPGTGMVVTSDIGDLKDIHPGNKQDVGRRLAQLALHRHYNIRSGYDSGPLFRNLIVNGNSVTVFFDYSDGMHTRSGTVEGFEIAGDDHQYYHAYAVIEDGAVILSSDNVAEPRYVRFGWSNTAEPDLFNKAGLPASSFTTDLTID